MTHLAVRCEVISRQSIFSRLRCSPLPDEILPGSFLRINDHALYISEVDKKNQILEVCVHGMNAEAALSENRITASLYASGHALCADNQPVLISATVEKLGAFILAARLMRHLCNANKSLFVLASESIFPFRPAPSKFVVRGVPAHVIAGFPLLEDWGLPTRLVSTADLPGVYGHTIEQFVEDYLGTVCQSSRDDVYYLQL